MASISRSAWAAYATPDVVARRAAGRKHYNAVRAFRRDMRRARIPELLDQHGLSLWERGTPRKLGALLGVSQETARLDVLAILDYAREASRCPCCGGRTVPGLRRQAQETSSQQLSPRTSAYH
jgi:hypothetical protein